MRWGAVILSTRTMPDEHQLLTTKEAPAMLRISRQSLYHLMAGGKIMPVERTQVLKQPRLKFKQEDIEGLLRRVKQPG